MKKLALIYLLVQLLMVQGCSNDDPDPETSFGFEKPEHFPEPTYTFENNPITEEGFALGRKIFFDPLLSKDGSVSCANCHNQAVAFSDPQHNLSIGVDGSVGTRNAPALANMAFMKEFFLDGGVSHLDFVPLNAIESPVEMGETISNVIDKLNNDPEYPVLFEEAFGETEITSPRLLHALAQFTAMMVSASSRYDRYLAGEEQFTSEELEGLQLFESKCSGCHSGVLFTDQSFRNNGLDETFKDRGRAIITELASDEGKFKVPSLRNVAITNPYMHDARFFTLEEVLDHYASGVVQSPTLDPSLVNGIALTEVEKSNIIAFLSTLTDTEFTHNPIFRNSN